MKQKYYLLIIILFSCFGFAHTGKDSLLVKSTNTVKTPISSPKNNVLDFVTKQLLREMNAIAQ